MDVQEGTDEDDTNTLGTYLKNKNSNIYVESPVKANSSKPRELIEQDYIDTNTSDVHHLTGNLPIPAPRGSVRKNHRSARDLTIIDTPNSSDEEDVNIDNVDEKLSYSSLPRKISPMKERERSSSDHSQTEEHVAGCLTSLRRAKSNDSFKIVADIHHISDEEEDVGSLADDTENNDNVMGSEPSKTIKSTSLPEDELSEEDSHSYSSENIDAEGQNKL